MTTRTTPKPALYATLAACALLAALVLHRPELAAAALPFALVLVPVLGERTPGVELTELRLGRQRVLEGERIEGLVALRAAGRIDQLRIDLITPAGVTAEPPGFGLTMAAGEERALRFHISCTHWGGYTLGRVALTAHDRHGLFEYEQVLARAVPLRVYPRAETVRAMIVPRDTQPYAGNLVARRAGAGIEFADVRPYRPGDRVRAINWRASARRNVLLVSDRHREQNSDVIIFLDTFADLRGRNRGSLDLAVRAAAGLAARYLQDKDRVGLVAFGGVLRWLIPGGGIAQLYQIVEALLTTDIVFSYAWKHAGVIPRRMLPANALIIALTPLLDDRGAQALLDLRARGYDIAIVEISPEQFLARPASDVERLARKLWHLERDSLRLRYRRLGIAVAEWRDDAPAGSVVEEVRRSRRFSRVARVS